MDGSIFRSRCEKLRTGEFVNDPSVFEYAENAMCEWRQLFQALRTCCSLQKQKIEMLRQMNSALEKSMREYRNRIKELEDRVVAMNDTINGMELQFCPDGGDQT